MQIYYLILGVLGVWRITHLLSQENGPGRILEKLRRIAGNGFWGQLMACFYCLSLWVSGPFALLLGRDAKERVLLWLAISGGAILLQRISPGFYVPGTYMEDTEDEHVLR